ncbi:MAG: HAD family hydrolase [Eubacterium sp.]|nr:HAD family hydrolase [Eubacterium sp.]
MVFDYDGTLHNTIIIYEKAFRKCYQWLLEQNYVAPEEISTDRISGWLGMNAKDMWNSFQPDLQEEVKETASAKIGEEMLREISGGKGKWYPKAEAVLNRLKDEGYPMIVLSNCKIAYKKVNWDVFQMEQWFREFFDCESFGFAPKEEIIQKISKKYEQEMIVIGDRDSDWKAAKAIEAKFIGCAYGYGSRDELKQADAVVESVEELPKAIRLFTEV